MRSKIFLIIALSTSVLALNACPKTSNTTLSQQYETGALQWQVVRREIDPNTLIHLAILENAPEVIKFLIVHGVDVDYPDNNGMPPLTIAILNRCNYAVEILLYYGANVNPKVKWNDMSLISLAQNMKDGATATLLLEHGALATNQDFFKALTFSRTCSFNEKSVWLNHARKMIDRGVSINPDQAHQNPLRLAIELAIDGDQTILESMIKAGVNLNCIFPECGYPPLMYVLMDNSKSFQIDLAKFLVKSGANVNQEDPFYGTPLTYTIQNINQPGFVEFIKFLIQSKIDLNQKIEQSNNGNSGITPLTLAIQNNSFNAVKYLVEAGADVNKKASFYNKPPRSPIELALQLSRPEIVQYLLQHGARG